MLVSCEYPTPPIYVAIASVFLIPVLSLVLVAMGILLLVSWPVMPFWIYKQKRNEQK